jgi:4-amino-4-deoxychorismate lyase
MCLFLETIKISNGIPQNLQFHQKRIDETIKEVFKAANPYSLKELSKRIKVKSSGVFKLRIVYNYSELKYEIMPYKLREIKTLKKVYSDIQYNYKYENREEISELFKMREDYDDILIIKNGLVTDTSYANIIFFDGEKFLTPDLPLLKGTKREMLIEKGKIYEAKIEEKDLANFQYAKIINAMIEIDDTKPIAIPSIK